MKDLIMNKLTPVFILGSIFSVYGSDIVNNYEGINNINIYNGTIYYEGINNINIYNGTIYIDNGKIIHSNGVVGSGNRTQKIIQIPGSPSQVGVSFGNLTIKQGSEQSLVVHADDNIHDYLNQVVSPTSIQLGVKENSSFTTKNPIEYTLTLRDTPSNLVTFGSGRIAIESIKAKRVQLALSGASAIYIKRLDAKKLITNISGASNVTIDNGSINSQEINCSGASYFNAAALKAISTRANFSGVSQGKVHSQHVSGSVSGKSKLAIYGKPSSSNVNLSTSGMSSYYFD